MTANPAFKPRRQYAYDLGPDDHLEEELKAALADAVILLYDVTRLLPGEPEAVRAEGLRALSDELRRAKLDYALGYISEKNGRSSKDRGRCTGPIIRNPTDGDCSTSSAPSDQLGTRRDSTRCCTRGAARASTSATTAREILS